MDTQPDELDQSLNTPKRRKPLVYSAKEVRVITVNETALAEPQCNRADLCVAFFQNVVTKASWFDAEKECVIVLLPEPEKPAKELESCEPWDGHWGNDASARGVPRCGCCCGVCGGCDA